MSAAPNEAVIDAGTVRAPALGTGRRDSRLGAAVSRYGLIAALLLAIAVFSALRPDSFATWDNLRSILTLAAPLGIAALGFTVVLIVGEFDAAFGAVIGLSGAASFVLMTDGLPWPLATLVALGIGLAAGSTAGGIVAFAGASSIIVTLALSTVLIGVEYLFTDQETLYGSVPTGFTNLGQSEPLLGINAQVWIALLVAVLLHLVLSRTEAGRYLHAIGGNRDAALLSGVRVKALGVTAFAVSGLCAAIAGLLIAAQSASSSPAAGQPYLLPAIAAAFLGSAMVPRGGFSVPGTIVGVLFLGVIQTGLTMLELSTAIVNVVQGAILIIAVVASRFGQRR